MFEDLIAFFLYPFDSNCELPKILEDQVPKPYNFVVARKKSGDFPQTLNRCLDLVERDLYTMDPRLRSWESCITKAMYQQLKEKAEESAKARLSKLQRNDSSEYV